MTPHELGLAGFGAVELANLLASKQVSAREVLLDHLAVIEEHNPVVNAICTLTAAAALEDAGRADSACAAGRSLGPLHGIPILHKDVFETAGVRTTFGSLTHRDHMPVVEATVVQRCRDAGALMLGKTNTPQFATGGHTSNRIFGTTRNPLDPSQTAGGSSGGSAAALAARMAPLATGTDMAGSLRVPSAFCGTVGMRPTPGRVPVGSGDRVDAGLTVAGPMARSVEDLTLLFSVLAQHEINESSFTATAPRVAWCGEPTGVRVDPEIAQALAVARDLFSVHCPVEEAEPDLREARACFEALRGRQYALDYAHWLVEAPDLLDPLVRANVEKGLTVTDEDVVMANQLRGRLRDRATQFFSRFDVLVAPGSVILPFSAEQWTPDGGEGREGTAYLDWLEPYVRFSVLGSPVLLLPVGRTAGGHPVSVQLVAAPGRDVDLLAVARFIDCRLHTREESGVWNR